jgi:hypothetical protein
MDKLPRVVFQIQTCHLRRLIEPQIFQISPQHVGENSYRNLFHVFDPLFHFQIPLCLPMVVLLLEVVFRYESHEAWFSLHEGDC